MSAFETSELFGGLDAGLQNTLRAMAREQTFSAGQEIFREGDPGDGLYLVLEGEVQIAGGSGTAGQHVFTVIGPGGFFGEMAVIEHKPRSASARALGPVKAMFFPRGELLALVERSPSLALGLLRQISGRLREFDRQHLEEALQAERLTVIGRFARSIIHDLRNPLSIIGLSAEVASMPSTGPEMRQKALTRVKEQVERINELASEVLEFTHGSTSAPAMVAADYGAFVGEVLRELESYGAARQISIEVSGQPQAMVAFNRKRLRRVFQNLVHNAADAMAAGGKVYIRFQVTPSEVVTEVEDTGPGIAPEITKRLFQPFATFGKEHGTGLGLSICRRILEEHKGWISARSEPGHGAIFAFGLPLNAS